MHSEENLFCSCPSLYLNYGLCVNGSASATTLARIKRLQLKCVKYISGDTMLHEKMHFRNCRLLPSDSMYKKSILMKFGDYVHNDCSLYFDGRLNEVQLLHTYSTRQCQWTTEPAAY